MKVSYVLSALGVLIAAAFASEQGLSRPGGVYQTMFTPTAEACSAACATDNLCMAWNYTIADQSCELKAVAPAPVRAEGIVSGVAARAPAFVRVEAAPAEPPAPPPPSPPSEHLAPPAVVTRVATTADDDLLGGADDELTLRAHLPDED